MKRSMALRRQKIKQFFPSHEQVKVRMRLTRTHARAFLCVCVCWPDVAANEQLFLSATAARLVSATPSQLVLPTAQLCPSSSSSSPSSSSSSFSPALFFHIRVQAPPAPSVEGAIGIRSVSMGVHPVKVGNCSCG